MRCTFCIHLSLSLRYMNICGNVSSCLAVLVAIHWHIVCIKCHQQNIEDTASYLRHLA